MIAWVLGGVLFGSPLANTLLFQPRIVPSSVAKRNCAATIKGFPSLSNPEIGNAPLDAAMLKTTPVGVPLLLAGLLGLLGPGWTRPKIAQRRRRHRASLPQRHCPIP